MQQLSVVLATFNEEKNLPKCLNSIANLADEIIVIDGSSTDKTVEIARKYGAKVAIVKNQANFHINKQKAVDMATKDWILQLDADELVSKELASEIKTKVKNSTHAKENGYWIPRKNWFLGRFLMKGGQYPDYTLRLYARGKGRLPQKDVHEQAEVQGAIGYMSNPLLHYPYGSFTSYINKWNRYNDLLSEQLKDKLEKRNFIVRIMYGIGYLIIRPVHWFLISYFRHKGFMDAWDGFIFSFFSALRFPVAYLKYLRKL